MKTLFTNAKIMTMKQGADIFTGDLVVDNDKIIYCGKKYEADADKTIDCHSNLLMPGFKDAHTHTAMTFVRNIADDKPLDKWLNEDIFPREARLTDEAVYWFTKLGILEYLTSGITACADMYFRLDAYTEAMINSGFRTVMVDGANNFGGSAKQIEECYNKYNKISPLISYIPGFHAEYTTSLELMTDIANLVNDLKAPMYVHNSETASEVAGCIERYGKTPTELFDSLGMYNYGGGGYHCVYMSDNDYRIFKEKNLYAVTNPASNLKLASGIADIERMRKEGIHVALGTDGPSSNNALDFFREMYLMTGLQKAKTGDATATPAAYVLDSATVQGAHAMRLYDCDILEEGKQADIIMIDLNQPNMQPIHNVASSVVYSGCKTNVKMTMIAGKILYMDGKFNVGDEPETVYEKVSELLKGIV